MTNKYWKEVMGWVTTGKPGIQGNPPDFWNEAGPRPDAVYCINFPYMQHPYKIGEFGMKIVFDGETGELKSKEFI